LDTTPSGSGHPSAPLEGATPSRARPILEARDISKAFGHVHALEHVDFDLLPGEVMGLVGDNGAGKSTLVKILSGALLPDSGQIFVDGSPVQFRNPVDAQRQGIETVHQDLAVVPMMDIAENLFLGRESRMPGPVGRILDFVNKRSMRRQASEDMRLLNIGVKSVRQRVETLSGGQRQGVAVARSITFGRKIVIMDEPTAALGVRESRGVVDLMRRIRERGLSIILISHNMPQVLEITDRVTVLRQGHRVGVVHTADTDVEQIVRLITGAEILRDPAA
jgi:fructose transport system ATP-binding protein